MGIDGIRPQVTLIEAAQGDYSLRTISLLHTATELMYPNYITSESGWEPVIPRKVSSNPLKPAIISANKKVLDDGVRWCTPSGDIMFTATQLSIFTKKKPNVASYTVNTLTVKYPILGQNAILTSDKWLWEADAIERDFKMLLCAGDIAQRLVKECNTTSFEILRKVGLHEADAITYMLCRPEFFESVSQDFGFTKDTTLVTRYNTLLEFVQSYLADYNRGRKLGEVVDIEVGDKYETAEIINQILEGSLNIGLLATGIDLDGSAGSAPIVALFNVLVYCLEQEPTHIWQKLKELVESDANAEQYEFEFSSPLLDLPLKTTLYVSANAVNYSKEDTLQYAIKQANTASFAIWATEIITTPSVNGVAPVPIGLKGFKMMLFNKPVKDIIIGYRNAWTEYAAQVNAPTEMAPNLAINIVMATALGLNCVKVGNLPVLNIEDTKDRMGIEDGVIYVTPAVRNLRQYVSPCMESFFNLTSFNTNVSKDVEFYFYITNGRMSTDNFYPYNGVKLNAVDITTLFIE